jgi:hypothetical protein
MFFLNHLKISSKTLNCIHPCRWIIFTWCSKLSPWAPCSNSKLMQKPSGNHEWRYQSGSWFTLELGFNLSLSKVIWPQKGWIKKKKSLKIERKKFIFPWFPMCSHYVPFKFPKGSHEVLNTFPKFSMCSPTCSP